MNAMDEAIKECPGMSLTQYALYDEKEENMTPSVLKILPKMVDIKKKNLTPEEEEILATPIQERVEFDNLFVFEEGVRLSQLMAILAFYDVTPKVIPTYTLASVKPIKDSTLNDVFFMDLAPKAGTQFTRQYIQVFGKSPSRLGGLAYDSVNWICQTAVDQTVHLADLQQGQTFEGADGLVRLNADGTNNRAMRLVQKKGRSAVEVQPAPMEFDLPIQIKQEVIEPTSELTDLTLKSPATSVESLDHSESTNLSVAPEQWPED